MFGGRFLFYYATPLAGLLLYSYGGADFMKRLLKNNEKKLAMFYYLMFNYLDDVLSLNNPMFDDYFDHIYRIDLEIQNIRYS